jgi:hypothetical protein
MYTYDILTAKKYSENKKKDGWDEPDLEEYTCELCEKEGINYITQGTNNVWENFYCEECFMKIYKFMNNIINTCNCDRCEESRKKRGEQL